MKRRPKPPGSEEKPSMPAADAGTILQVKVWLTGISPMVWRRILVSTANRLQAGKGLVNRGEKLWGGRGRRAPSLPHPIDGAPDATAE